MPEQQTQVDQLVQLENVLFGLNASLQPQMAETAIIIHTFLPMLIAIGQVQAEFGW